MAIFFRCLLCDNHLIYDVYDTTRRNLILITTINGCFVFVISTGEETSDDKVRWIHVTMKMDQRETFVYKNTVKPYCK